MTKVSDELLREWIEKPTIYASDVKVLARELLQRRGWQKCDIHGDINADHAWGCPECVREMRGELALRAAEPVAPGRWVPEELLRRLLLYAESIRLEDVPSNLPVFADIDALHELLYGVAPEDKP